MYILYKRIRKQNDADREIVLEAEILDPAQYAAMAARVKDRNIEKTAVEYVIIQVDDESLTAFLARDRRYDLTKYDETAAEIRQQIDALNAAFNRLDAFYRSARDSNDTTQSDR